MFFSRTDSERLRLSISTVPPSQQKLDAIQELLARFRRTYRDLEFEVMWDNMDEVNSWASLTRKVWISGGLIAHPAVGVECLALMLSHEVAHYRCDCPRMETGLACEGHADYLGVRYEMPLVLGDDYPNIIVPALAQAWSYWRPSGQSNTATECNTHPDAECRIATFEAAVAGDRMPDCAKPPADRESENV